MKHRLFLFLFEALVMAVLVLTACGTKPATYPESLIDVTKTSQEKNQGNSNPTPEDLLTSTPLEKSTYPAQLRITTTSDWTTVRLVEGTWHNLEVVFSSKEAQYAGIEGEGFSLRQTIAQAEAGQRVELIADVSFTEFSPDGMIVIEIDRGFIGITQVDILSLSDDESRIAANLTWEGIKTSGNNQQTFEIPADKFNLDTILSDTLPTETIEAEPTQTDSIPFVPTLSTKANEYIVIGQLNFWYYGPGEYGGFEDSSGNRMTPLTPLLGKTYWAEDPDVVYQQIEWAVEYGVDAFSIEWTTPRGIGCCGSMENTLDDVFLKSPNINKVRWTIFYDFVLRLDQTKTLDFDRGGPINFNQPDVYNTFVSDFVHFAKKYFDHPQYLNIDGRPVIYIWATSFYTGDMAGVIREARQRVAELGFDVYIVGDEVNTGKFDPARVSLFDATTTFSFLIPGLDWYSLDDVGKGAVEVDKTFQWWRDQQAGIKVAGRDELVIFQPGWAPQYDERNIVFDNPKYVPALSIDQVLQMAMVARKHAEPAGSHNMRLIWLNTWNNWAETTTVEPTANLGPKYPAGNYQFDMLEVIRDVFGVETFFTSLVP